MTPSEIEIYREAEAALQYVVNLIESGLDQISDEETKNSLKSRIESVKHYIYHGEIGIAYENMVDHIYDLSIPISREIYQGMEKYSLCFPTPPEDHKILIELVVDS
ncbi:MAG: MafI family immunity protein [Thermostichus sp. HHBFW_bins_43]